MRRVVVVVVVVGDEYYVSDCESISHFVGMRRDVEVVMQFRGRRGGWQVETWVEQSERSQIELPSGPCVARCRKRQTWNTKRVQKGNRKSFPRQNFETGKVVRQGPNHSYGCSTNFKNRLYHCASIRGNFPITKYE